METLDKLNEYGALEEKIIYRKTITETNTNHVEECRVAQANKIKINEQEEDKNKLMENCRRKSKRNFN